MDKLPRISRRGQGSLKIFDAVSKNGKKIATGEKIKVVDVVDTDTLVVEKFE